MNNKAVSEINFYSVKYSKIDKNTIPIGLNFVFLYEKYID